MATLTASTDRLRLQLLAGVPLDPSTELPARVGRGVALATSIGAPLLPAVEAAAEAEDDESRARRAVAVSTAQARTVARALALAPLVLAPGIGRLAGVNVGAFYATPAGRVVLGVGAGLIIVGGLVARMLVAHAARASADASLEESAELLAIALTGGLGTAAALRAVADVLPAHAERLRRLALDVDLGIRARADVEEPEPFQRIREVVVTAADLGAPAAPTLRRLARDLRGAELARLMAAAERLPAQLTVPTTLLLLPATLLLVGAPLVASGLAAVLP